MAISKELAKGSTALLVLSVLKKEDLYGYQIIRTLEIMSEKVFQLNEGTLYPILHAFEKDGYVTSYWIENESARKRKYYRITDKGIKALSKNKEEWTSYSSAVNKVIGKVSHVKA